MKLQASDLDYRLIYDHYIAGRRSAVLTVALKLEIFTVLERSPLSITELSEKCDLSLRGCTGIVRSLMAMQLLNELDNLLYNTPESSAFLIKGKEGYIGALMEMEWDNFLSPKNLLAAAKEDRPTVYGQEDVWENHSMDLENSQKFTAAMHSISTQPALALANLPIWQQGRGTLPTTILDMGCGSAVYSIALLQKHPQLTAVAADLPAMRPIIESYLKQYDVQDRAYFLGIDMFRESWPQASAIILSQILHDWNPTQCRLLLTQAFDALESNGLLVIHEKLTANHTHLPLANALVNLDMLIWTEGQQFAPAELEKLLIDVGFQNITFTHTAPYWSAIIAQK